MREEILDALGLQTAVNRQATKPGALLTARDVDIDRPGIIEPRPGMLWTLATVHAADYARACVGFASHLLTFLSSTHCIDETAGAEITGLAAEPRPTQRTYGLAAARGSLYATGVNGVQKLDAVSGAGLTWQESGLQKALGGTYETPVYSHDPASALIKGGPWQLYDAVAYRAVLVRKDRNGYIRRSEPSERLVFYVGDATSANSILSYVVAGPGFAITFDQAFNYPYLATDRVEMVFQFGGGATTAVVGTVTAAASPVLTVTFDVGTVVPAPGDLVGPLRVTTTARAYGVAANLKFDLSVDAASGDTLEIYRSATSDGSVGLPSDQMFLAATVPVDNIAIFNKYILFTDTLPDTQLGVELYTNSTQLGILQAKTRPPWCSDLASYNTMEFYADYETPWRLNWGLYNPALSGLIEYPATGAITATKLWPSNVYLSVGAGNDPTTAHGWIGSGGVTTVSGSATAATAVDMSYLVGAIIVEGTSPQFPGVVGANIPAFTKILSATSGSITMSNPATGSALVGGVTFWPTFTVAGVDFYGTSRDLPANREFPFIRTFDLVNNVALVPLPAMVPLLKLASLINNNTGGAVAAWATAINETADGLYWRDSIQPRILLEYTTDYTNTAPIVTQNVLGKSGAAHMGEGSYLFTTPQSQATGFLAPYALGTSVFLRDAFPGGVCISQVNEPEAVPVVNSVLIGNSSATVRRMIATRSALWVIKDDGLFRMTGYSPEALNVDVVDPTLRLLHSEAACASADMVYAWTAKGVAAISDAGVVIISEPIRDQLIAIESLFSSYPASAAGIFMVYDQAERRVILGVPADASSTAAAQCFVWSERTQAWTTWALVPSSGCWDPGTGQTTLCETVPGTSSRYVLRASLRSMPSGFYTGDDQREDDVSAASLVGGVWQVTLTSPAVPPLVVGDALASDPSTTSRVTGVVSASIYQMDNSLMTAGMKPIVLRAAQSRIQWNISSGRGFDLKVWTDSRIVWNMLELMTAYTMTYGTGTQKPGGYQTTAQPVTVPLRHDVYDYARKVGVPYEAGLGATFQATLDIAQGGANWLIGGFAVMFEPGGDEVSP